MNIAIVNYRSGNLHSALKSFEAAAADFRNVNVKITSCYKEVLSADKVVLPGVGSFSFCKSKLLENTDIYKALCDLIIDQKKPFLGICVGMQILSDRGHEDKITKGLGIISGEIKKFKDKKLIIPHMGWNSIKLSKEDRIIKKNLDKKDFYFVHSYIFENIEKKNVLATTIYGKNFPSIVKKGNIYGVQFHPEKSHKYGLNLIKNYILKS